jgi:hypothetical protein
MIAKRIMESVLRESRAHVRTGRLIPFSTKLSTYDEIGAEHGCKGSRRVESRGSYGAKSR